jgi:hypothetical protein
MKHYETIDQDIIAKSEELYPKFDGDIVCEINRDIARQNFQQGAMWGIHGDWISRDERLPTLEDAFSDANEDYYQCVWAYNRINEKVTKVFYKYFIKSIHYTHWQPIRKPQAPKE